MGKVVFFVMVMNKRFKYLVISGDDLSLNILLKSHVSCLKILNNKSVLYLWRVSEIVSREINLEDMYCK